MVCRWLRFVPLLGLACSAPRTAGAGALVPVALRCEDLDDPLGLDQVRPRLTWQLRGDAGAADNRQEACRVLVASRRELLEQERGDLWDSGVVSNAVPALVYDGAPLRALAECFWRVQVRGQGGWSPWSGVARWSLGPLLEADWPGPWMGAATARPDQPDPWLRTTFELTAPPVRAVAHVASLGFHQLWANGARAGTAALAPAICDLGQRALSVSYDVTPLLRPGRNAVALWLAAGWAGFPEFAVPAAPLARVRLDIRCADGSTRQVVSGGSWRTAASASQRVGTWKVWDYGGERVDAARAQVAFAAPDLDDHGWAPAVEYAPAVTIRAAALEPDQTFDTLSAQDITALPDGSWRVDLGRAVTGFLSARVRGPAGGVVTLRCSERIEQPMSYNQRSELVLGADGSGEFRNRFNVFSGRWITLSGCARPETVTAQLVRGGFARTGEFACSDPLLQRIHDTAVWTLQCLAQYGMLVDCPHRERCGYGGDAHATVRTALTHFGMTAFYRKWLADWRDVQTPDGNLPYTAPTRIGGGGPAWSGICIQLPWELYVATGDRRMLADNWPMMQRWLQFLRGHVQGGLLRKYGHPDWGFLGDWVPPGRGQSAGERVDERSTLFFNNAYWLLCVRRAAAIAALLGQDARELESEAHAIRLAVHREFFDADTASYANGEQPYLALALLADVPPLEQRARVLARLEQVIRQKAHIDAGIHGHRFVLDALTEAGRADLVALMARQTDWPGWGWMLEQGATTVWEQWDGKESRMHSSFLGIAGWCIEGLAGIRPDESHPGGAQVQIRPGIDSGLAAARARWDLGRGAVTSDWRVADGMLTLRVELPPGVRATVRLPTSGPVRVAGAVQVDGQRGADAVPDSTWELTLGAGRHEIAAAVR